MVCWGWPTRLSPLVVAQFMAQFNALLLSYDDYLDPRLVAQWLLRLQLPHGLRVLRGACNVSPCINSLV